MNYAEFTSTEWEFIHIVRGPHVIFHAVHSVLIFLKGLCNHREYDGGPLLSKPLRLFVEQRTLDFRTPKTCSAHLLPLALSRKLNLFE